MPTPKQRLENARKNKKDEFYTQITDIENELQHYKDHFINKVIFLNCDDPDYSNFWIYFANNFSVLKLKRLIATHYKPKGQSYYLEINQYGQTCIPISLESNGDFRSQECIDILKQADIVVTNPPFSLFQEYIMQLIEHKKKFLILGSLNKLTITNVFKQVMAKRIWLGINHGAMSFKSSYENTQSDKQINDLITIPNMCWFTNLEHFKRKNKLILTAKYNPNDYPMYVNYDAINVDKVTEIPKDYEGVIGVPISYMHKHNPKQFRIIGKGTSNLCKFKKNYLTEQLAGRQKGTITKNCKGCLFLKYDPGYRNGLYTKSVKYKDTSSGAIYVKPFARILIKNIKVK